MRCKVWCSFFLLAALLGFTCPGFAQGTGTVHGTVTDRSGAAVPSAEVVATHVERGVSRSVMSNDAGEYVFNLLPVGTYTVRVQAKGFQSAERQGISLTTAQNVRTDFAVEIGNVSETVSVTAEATLVDTRSAQVGTLVDSRRIVELPINGRNAYALAILTPGVVNVRALQSLTFDRDGTSMTVNGSRENQNLFLMDGAYTNSHFRNHGNIPPPPDALQEVKLITNSFDAQYGRNGGAIINVTTKSGSNSLHGGLWEFLRNHELNARNFFDGPRVAKLIQNQYGGSAGGRVIKDRLFFFGTYEGFRIRPAPQTSAQFPLTAAERTGDFSRTTRAIRDPSTGVVFPGNLIPSSRLDPAARNIVQDMPQANLPNGELRQTAALPINAHTYLGRADYILGKHNFDVRYYRQNTDESAYEGGVPTYGPIQRARWDWNANAGDTIILSPKLIANFRVALSRNNTVTSVFNLKTLADYGGKFPLLAPKEYVTAPSIGISGRIDMQGGRPNLSVNQNFLVSGSMNWTHDRHNIKFGGDSLRLKYIQRAFDGSNGGFTFSGNLSGDAAADFMLGNAENFSITALEYNGDFRQYNWYAYVQDDFRIHPRLTLNLGLRYEMSPPWFHVQNFLNGIRPGQRSTKVPNAPYELLFPGDPGVPNGMYQTDKNNWAPRFGFAWDPLGTGRTSVRGAYGIFYDTINQDCCTGVGNQPFRSGTGYGSTGGVVLRLSDPFATFPIPSTVVDYKNPIFTPFPFIASIDGSIRTPYLQNFNLNVQREILPNLVVQAGYVGKLGRKLVTLPDINDGIPQPGGSVRDIQQRRPYREIGRVFDTKTAVGSAYHAMQVEVNKRFSHSFSLQAAYTWSKNIDMGSTAAQGGTFPNMRDWRPERALADYDAKHIFSGSWLWELPQLRGRNIFLRQAAGGWQVNGLVSMRSGYPFAVRNGRDVAFTGVGAWQRTNVTGDPYLSDDRSRAEKLARWINTAAFTFPADGTFGNQARNALRGPASSVVNMGFFKSFPVTERVRLQFRSEFFNLFNSANFLISRSEGTMALTSGANFGRVTRADASRVIQFALKLQF